MEQNGMCLEIGCYRWPHYCKYMYRVLEVSLGIGWMTYRMIKYKLDVRSLSLPHYGKNNEAHNISHSSLNKVYILVLRWLTNVQLIISTNFCYRPSAETFINWIVKLMYCTQLECTFFNKRITKTSERSFNKN